MTTIDKLKSFEDYAINQVQNLRRQSYDNFKTELTTIVREQMKGLDEQLNTQLKYEYTKLIHNKNKEIVNKRDSLNKKLSQLYVDNNNTIYNNVKKSLYNFKETENYIDFLKDGITKFAKGANKVILTKDDEIYVNNIKDIVEKKVYTTGDFIGGFILHHSPNIILDNSFKTALHNIIFGA